MKNQIKSIQIAVGASASSAVWKNTKTTWADFAERLKTPVRTNETYKEYMSMNKADQGSIKDVGGYVAGYLRGGRRKADTVVSRSVLTLDIDFANLYFWDDFVMAFDFAAVLHSTHKHSPESPRFRLVIPLSREATPDEYQAVGRYVAGVLGIELFDDTTFEPNRLMFWPSCSKDADYVYEGQTGDFLDTDEALGTYAEWTDSTAWPVSDRKGEAVRKALNKQEDPTEKKGIIGAFCRAYTIEEALSELLSDKYEEVVGGRYTYAGGTTAGGLVLYDNLFAYSHHGTDPAGGKLCNAFDLVRVHLFGHLDEDGQSKASFAKMEEYARNDKRTKALLADENIAAARYDFDEEYEHPEAAEEVNLAWAEGLEVDAKGKYTSSAANLSLILANDPRLKGAFMENVFDIKRYAVKSLPWRKVKGREPVKNVDYSGVRNYIETVYGIASTLKTEDAMALEFEKNAFHPVREYLEALTWDGVRRLDTLLTDYLGADDNLYTREAVRKALVGAVARVFAPGIKFDLVLTLVGGQGLGKSTFLRKLGGAWFSDSFNTVKGKEAFEQIQGAWIIEMAELSGIRKAEVEAVKHFITKQDDTFRPAYGRAVETHKRQCVFFGTTNNRNFLIDPSGNRRFLPVDVLRHPPKKDVFTGLEAEVGQIWAEAVDVYRNGEALFLSPEADRTAKAEQRGHSETDERAGLIEDYLSVLLPRNWELMGVAERRMYLAQEDKPETGEARSFVCVAEIWSECLGKDKADMSRYNTREINDILRGLEGWAASSSTKNFKLYGKQKYYAREN